MESEYEGNLEEVYAYFLGRMMADELGDEDAGGVKEYVPEEFDGMMVIRYNPRSMEVGIDHGSSMLRARLVEGKVKVFERVGNLFLERLRDLAEAYCQARDGVSLPGER